MFKKSFEMGVDFNDLKCEVKIQYEDEYYCFTNNGLIRLSVPDVSLLLCIAEEVMRLITSRARYGKVQEPS